MRLAVLGEMAPSEWGREAALVLDYAELDSGMRTDEPLLSAPTVTCSGERTPIPGKKSTTHGRALHVRVLV